MDVLPCQKWGSSLAFELKIPEKLTLNIRHQKMEEK